MKTNRMTLAALFVGIALVVSALLLGAFHLGMEYYIRNSASLALEDMICFYENDFYDGNTSEETHLYAMFFYPNFHEEEAGFVPIDDYYYNLEEDILNWVKKHADYEQIYRVELNERQYYIEYTKRIGEDAIVYVDTTPEYNLVDSISLILVFALFLSIIGSASVGLAVGTRIEKDRNQQKEFFENASHELKTPLMVIEGYSDGLSKGMIPVETATSIIHEEVVKMTRLVNEILSISRLESGATKIQKEEVSLQELLENSIYPLQYQAVQKGIKVESKIEDQMILADPVQMDKAFSNLFNNALRYADTMICVEADKKGVRISNDGNLPDADALNHLFDRFYTGDKGHAGIGLALTKEIVQKHGWKISAAIDAGFIVFTIQF